MSEEYTNGCSCGDSCSSSCDGCCDSCSSSCGGEQNNSLLVAQNPMSDIKKVIAVVSGKGGVGKSLVTSLMSVAMHRKGKRTAILDADVTGPSIPKMFGKSDKATASQDGIFPVESQTGIELMSVNFLLDDETSPVLWRGPVISGVVTQFWQEVLWGDIDFMFVDMPPGTGDVPLTVFQSLPIDGIIVVTSPQELVGMIVEKAVNMANMMNIPILGIVENMSYFKCPDCGEEHKIFGESHIDEIADKYNIKTVAKLPMASEIAAAADAGCIEKVDMESLTPLVDVIENL